MIQLPLCCLITGPAKTECMKIFFSPSARTNDLVLYYCSIFVIAFLKEQIKQQSIVKAMIFFLQSADDCGKIDATKGIHLRILERFVTPLLY
jgi:hypothetical protein